MRTAEEWAMSTLPIPSIPGRPATVEDRLYRDDGVKWERMYTETEVRAVRAEALEDIAKHIDQTADLAGEAADHKAEGVLRGVAENIRALTAGENRQ